MRVARSVVGTVVLATASALAADTPIKEPKPATPPPEDPIAAARRDLDAIKAARSGLQPQGKVELPSLSTSDLAVGTQAPWQPSTPGKSPADATKKKSANWLVDAMMKPPSLTLSTDAKGRALNGKTSRSKADAEEIETSELVGAAEVTRDKDGTLSAGASAAERKAADVSAPNRALSEPVVNPLANFMAGWMTPQDYKLLQTSGKGEGSAESLPGAGSAIIGAQAGPGLAGGAVPLFGQAPVGRPGASPRENPFLQDFNLSPVPATKSATAAAPAPSVTATPAAKPLPPPPEPAAQKPATPAFVKPNDDAKYFKPLKRF